MEEKTVVSKSSKEKMEVFCKIYSALMQAILIIGISMWGVSMFNSISTPESTIKREVNTINLNYIKTVDCPSCDGKAKYYLSHSHNYILKCDECDLVMEFVD